MQKGRGGKKAKYGSNPLGKYVFQCFQWEVGVSAIFRIEKLKQIHAIMEEYNFVFFYLSK